MAFEQVSEHYDVIVMGAGAAGLSAAVFGALSGAKVLLVERTAYVGGTSALSGGTVWAPGTAIGKTVNTQDTRAAVSEFLDSAVGRHGDTALRETFLDAAPEVISTLSERTQVAFRPYPKHPDYEWDHPHPTLNGRAIEPVPFDTRAMGRLRNVIRAPIPEFTVLGGMNIDRIDIGHLLNRYKSVGSFAHVAKIVLRYACDKALYGRHTRLVMGAALIGRLLASANDLGVEIVLETSATGMDLDGAGDAHLALVSRDARKTVRASGGVILASGGFGRSAERRRKYLPETLPSDSPSAPGHTARMHDLAETLGAVYGQGNDQNAFWAPCSIRTRPDGSRAVFPHFVLDRSKPGSVCVDRHGARFVNETRSYHAFGKAMLQGGAATQHAWIIMDAKGIAKYGLGMVRPGGDDLRPYLKDGYLIEARSIAELAAKTGTDETTLTASIDDINQAADAGRDDRFGRGESPYQRHNGDATVAPNPTLGVLCQAPYYAVKLQPADIGTAKGFAATPNAELLRADGTVITGVYAAGNDLHSIMGGTYPGPGITLGPGLVFGAIAARHAAARAKDKKGK
ncbi:FAD-dependent oxidoreductase [Thalassobius sp. S69A]|uniref:FAD-dependent oxidoreductase n=1 Tax=Thalassobius sp. S69A TaxID=3450125 RepID=UPI0040576473